MSVAGAPYEHRIEHAPRGPAALDRARVARLAIRVGVALAVARLRVGAAAAAHALVAGLDRACLIAGRIVEIRLDGCLCASQPTSAPRSTDPPGHDSGGRVAPPGAVPRPGRASEPQTYRTCWTAQSCAKKGPPGLDLPSCCRGRQVTPDLATSRLRRRFLAEPFVSIRRVVEVRLDRRRRATEAIGDLCD